MVCSALASAVVNSLSRHCSLTGPLSGGGYLPAGPIIILSCSSSGSSRPRLVSTRLTNPRRRRTVYEVMGDGVIAGRIDASDFLDFSTPRLPCGYGRGRGGTGGSRHGGAAGRGGRGRAAARGGAGLRPAGEWKLAGAVARSDADAGRGGLLGIHLRLPARHARDAVATGAGDGRVLIPQRLRRRLGTPLRLRCLGCRQPGAGARPRSSRSSGRSMPGCGSIPRRERS